MLTSSDKFVGRSLFAAQRSLITVSGHVNPMTPAADNGFYTSRRRFECESEDTSALSP
jgi:hypothetical protein